MCKAIFVHKDRVCGIYMTRCVCECVCVCLSVFKAAAKRGTHYDGEPRESRRVIHQICSVNPNKLLDEKRRRGDINPKTCKPANTHTHSSVIYSLSLFDQCVVLSFDYLNAYKHKFHLFTTLPSPLIQLQTINMCCMFVFT